MKNLSLTIFKKFPKIDFCELIDIRFVDRLPKEISSNYATVLNPWISYISKVNKSLDWMRVKVEGNTDLILRRVNDYFYIVTLNKIENTALLTSFIKNCDLNNLIEPDVEKKESYSIPESKIEHSELDSKIQEAVRIQQMIIPRQEDIEQGFKKFFVVHQQQDHVGGDFYWYRKIGDCVLLAVIDCTGHSVEGAMTSMVCNSLLTQCIVDFDPKEPEKVLIQFYDHLVKYNKTTVDILDYGIGAEVGLFCFNYAEREVKFSSTGIPAFVKRNDEMEYIKAKKIMDFTTVREQVTCITLPMDDISGIYSFTDGLMDQYDAADKKKMGRNGVRKMIESEAEFGSAYYTHEILKWRGNNMQYDDITLVGMAI